MKRKLFFGLVGGMLAIFSILSVNTTSSSISDISLNSITIMAQATAEVNPLCPTGCKENGNGCGCNGIWNDYWLVP